MIENLKNAKVVLFGAGRNGTLMLKMLLDDGITPDYFVDNSCMNGYVDISNKTQNKSVFPVKKPEEMLSEDKTNLKIIITPSDPWFDEIKAQVKKMGLESCLYPDEHTFDSKCCPVCGDEFDTYLPFGIVSRKNSQCPNCHALERHRALWLYIKNHTNILDANNQAVKLKMLHFAPEPAIYNKIREYPHIDYYPVDIDSSKAGLRDVVDIQSIQYRDKMFDVIICNHVLEHIPDDYRAMREMCRVLEKDGVAYISVPIKNMQSTFEDPAYNTPELRLLHYGQDDHVRIYGNDFLQRLRDSGFNADVIELAKGLTMYELYRYGLFRTSGSIFRCTATLKYDVHTIKGDKTQ